MPSRRPILVTGSHRSGSTWVGKMVSASPSVGYIHEPFHLNHSPGVCGAKFVHWFTYITDENESTYYEHLKKTIEFRYSTLDAIRTIKSLSDARRVLGEYKRFRTYQHRGVRPLIKDPIAVLSAGWLAKAFDMDVLVLIRHPAAFASSLKRLAWAHPFSHFLRQPLLMRDYLYPFETEIREYASEEHDIIDQASLLWKIIHHVIIQYENSHADWIFLRHEDISRDPMNQFRNLFERLHLDFSQHVKEKVQEYSDPSNPSEVPETGNALKRDSRSNVWNWKNRLTASEIERIREQVGDISRRFYSESDW